MDWAPIAEVIRDNPAGVAAVIGAIVAGIVQLVKRKLDLPTGEYAWAKIVVAVTTAVALSWAAQAATGEIDMGQFVSVALGAWLASAGLHSTQKALRGGE